ncbi:type VI secretion system baseplate subunit TssG [Pseudoxanthomonas putridarboris]|uniref:Type VI secretion system baseplate subunit TssG n=1 Tax=Pseudoxanthomonas putridarboris TaxID=752605 RepID=A0ABU9J601_9GAMM
MAAAARQPAGDLAGPLLDDAKNYAFFSLVEHLHRLHGDNMEQLLDTDPSTERIVFESDPGLGFPASDVLAAGRLEGYAQDSYRLVVSFLGLHGPDSPLPGHYLERVASDHAHGNGLRVAFLDFFNHRLLTLLHRTWRKYRYHVRFQDGARDRFSRCVFSLIGLNDERLRGQAPIPWSRLLTYAGLVASRSRSPTVVAGIIAHCFDLEQVAIREFQPKLIDIPDEQRTRLGQRAGTLGDSFMIGDRVRTYEHSFVIAISGLTQRRFRDFLPNGKDFFPLSKLIEFLLRDQLAYDLELGLRQQEIPPFQLDASRGGNLGWTTFAGNNSLLRQESVVRIKVRQ